MYQGANGQKYATLQEANASYSYTAPPVQASSSSSPYINRTLHDIAGYSQIGLQIVDSLIGLPGMNQQREVERLRLENEQIRYAVQQPQPVTTEQQTGRGPNWLLIGGIAGGVVIVTFGLVAITK